MLETPSSKKSLNIQQIPKYNLATIVLLGYLQRLNPKSPLGLLYMFHRIPTAVCYSCYYYILIIVH